MHPSLEHSVVYQYSLFFLFNRFCVKIMFGEMVWKISSFFVLLSFAVKADVKGGGSS
jgi:hypothetical protein